MKANVGDKMKMKAEKMVFLGIFILMLFILPVSCQVENWKKLIALESNRNEVEKILGKPEIYFETYGTYKTDIGEFSVWYSKGGCRNDVEGLQWDVPAGKMTRILFYPKKSSALETYVSSLKEFEKIESPAKNSRYLYTSPDETFIYQTIMRKDLSEFVYTIELQPSKDKQSLLCKNDKK